MICLERGSRVPSGRIIVPDLAGFGRGEDGGGGAGKSLSAGAGLGEGIDGGDCGEGTVEDDGSGAAAGDCDLDDEGTGDEKDRDTAPLESDVLD